MADADDNIPTLTDITHPGDSDMFKHFDAHQFDIEISDIKDEKIAFETDFKIDEKQAAENTKFNEDAVIINDDPELEIALSEMPPVQINTNNIDINDETTGKELSDVMQVLNNAADEKEKNDITNLELKEKIDQAIQDALPGIEAQLKGKLYCKFGI